MLKKYHEHNGCLWLQNKGSGGGKIAKEAMADKRKWEIEEGEREEGNEEEEEAGAHFNDLYVFYRRIFRR